MKCMQLTCVCARQRRGVTQAGLLCARPLDGLCTALRCILLSVSSCWQPRLRPPSRMMQDMWLEPQVEGRQHQNGHLGERRTLPLQCLIACIHWRTRHERAGAGAGAGRVRCMRCSAMLRALGRDQIMSVGVDHRGVLGQSGTHTNIVIFAKSQLGTCARSQPAH